ncbi:MAG: hypothetical protein RI967_695, partial [Planctomycetota bacterium]
MSIEPRNQHDAREFRAGHDADRDAGGAPTPAQIARRGFVLASLGFLAACASSKPTKSLASGGDSHPDGLWLSGDELP